MRGYFGHVLLFKGNADLGLIVSQAFGATAVMTLTFLGGSSPLIYTMFAALLVTAVAARRRIWLDLGLVFGSIRPVWILTSLMLYAIIGSWLFPRFFAGQTAVFVQPKTRGIVIEDSLAPGFRQHFSDRLFRSWWTRRYSALRPAAALRPDQSRSGVVSSCGAASTRGWESSISSARTWARETCWPRSEPPTTRSYRTRRRQDSCGSPGLFRGLFIRQRFPRLSGILLQLLEKDEITAGQMAVWHPALPVHSVDFIDRLRRADTAMHPGCFVDAGLDPEGKSRGRRDTDNGSHGIGRDCHIGHKSLQGRGV